MGRNLGFRQQEFLLFHNDFIELIKLICIKKAAFRKSEMLLDSYIHGNGTYDFLSCKCHHQLFAFLVIILLQIKE